MSKKNRIYLIVLIALGLTAYLLINKNNKGTMGNIKAFAVEDTAAIQKIVIANKTGAQVTLTKQNDGWWMVNDKFRARKALVGLVLDALKRMEVKSPVAAPSLQNVMKNIATSATRVSVYDAQGTELKAFYMGATTQDDMGNYSLLENEDKPQVVYLPGFNGYLSARFIVRPLEWKDATIFGTAPQEIDYVSVEYTGNPDWSFKVRLLGDEVAQITNMSGDTAKGNVNPEFFRNYLTKYRLVEYETLLDTTYMKRKEMDSVKAAKPYARISLKDKKGELTEVELHLFPDAIRKELHTSGWPIYDKAGNPLLDEGERIYCLIKKTGELTVVQNYSFRYLLVRYPDFFAAKPSM